MDKRCFTMATFESITSSVVIFTLCFLINCFAHLYTIPLILIFTLFHGIGSHLGFCMGYMSKTYSSIKLILIPILLNAIIIFIPLLFVKENENHFELSGAIFFTMSYVGKLSNGRNYFVKTNPEN